MQNISDLHPVLQSKIEQLLALCKKNGITIGITECVRTVAEQNALYAQGRTTPGNIVTNANGTSYRSMHQWGIAFDFCLRMDVDGDGNASDDTFNDSTGLFEKVGALGQSIGLEWGGSWTSIKDRPHFQLPDWGSTATKLINTYGTPERFRATWPNIGKVTTPQSTNSSSDYRTTSTYATVNATSGVNLRMSANVSSPRICGIANGKRVSVLSKGKKWTKVSYDGKVGYIATQYLTFGSVEKSAAKNGKVDSAKSFSRSYKRNYKTTANLNLRTGAGTSKSVIVTIPKNTIIHCYGYYTVSNKVTWLLVTYGKYTGYVSSKYVSAL